MVSAVLLAAFRALPMAHGLKTTLLDSVFRTFGVSAPGALGTLPVLGSFLLI